MDQLSAERKGTADYHEADALRLKIKPQPNAAAGILEIDIE